MLSCGALWTGRARVLAPTCCPRVIVKRAPTSTVKCPSLEDELHDHLKVKGTSF